MDWTCTLGELADAIGQPAGRRDITFTSVSTDTRTLRPGAVFFALTGDRFDGASFAAEALVKGAAAVVAARPVPEGPCVVAKNPLKALQDFAAWHRKKSPIPVIAITGSCGKTSTKDFMAEVLGERLRVVKTRGNLNNDIGCPLSLLEIGPDTEAAVIEMGANHMGEIAGLCRVAAPTEAAVTLVAPAHLEGFGSVENVARAKGEIVDGLPPDGVFYCNADDPWCEAMAARHPGRVVRFGTRGDVALRACSFADNGMLRLDIDPVGVIELPLPCKAHAHNVLLAVAAGIEHGVSAFEEPLLRAARNPSRFKVTDIGGLTVLDDTYNANPASMRAALETLAARPGGRKIAALGDMLELGAEAGVLHRETGALAGALGVDAVFARGDFAASLLDGADRAGVGSVRQIEDHAEMARAIRDVAQPGDVLLVKGSRGMQMERVINALMEMTE
jgi:UDP-N-acetylmuramoyl-tripeptide--D-alanyl-D-alanine ligase